MTRPLDGKLALVTGASSGIGDATARALAEAGAHLVLAARRRDRLAVLADQLGGADVEDFDVRNAGAVHEALSPYAFDVVVANAGLGLGLEPLHEGHPEEWAAMLDTNVKGVLHTLRTVLPSMRERGSGDVVLIGSVAGRQVYPNGNVYNASKHAVRAIYEALRLDEAGSGIRFTTVDPGMVETEFSLVRFRGDSRAARRVYDGMRPLRPFDVADAVRFAVTRPRHVNVGEIVLWPSDQASTRDVTRS